MRRRGCARKISRSRRWCARTAAASPQRPFMSALRSDQPQYPRRTGRQSSGPILNGHSKPAASSP
nr:MAG TPA: hypothetical protein [Caudoviricetes sp.]